MYHTVPLNQHGGNMDFKYSVIAGLAITAVLALFVYVAVIDENHWQEYVKKHHCVANGTKHGTIGTGIGLDSKGNATTVITSTPDQTIYVCDGGEIQIR